MQKRKRGRPKGTGLDDEERLVQAADLICRNPDMPVTTAFKQLGFRGEIELRRLRDKFSRQNERLLSDAEARLHSEKRKRIDNPLEAFFVLDQNVNARRDFYRELLKFIIITKSKPLPASVE
jgi:hypothetical protein